MYDFKFYSCILLELEKNQILFYCSYSFVYYFLYKSLKLLNLDLIKYFVPSLFIFDIFLVDIFSTTFSYICKGKKQLSNSTYLNNTNISNFIKINEHTFFWIFDSGEGDIEEFQPMLNSYSAS